ncbi:MULTISPECIES: hypothetical protein [Novosphingobium]|uniref:hypothetical protein n=1 Tax=Novosphingobium TaxID=165696 RepID=UPI0022F291C4|nr:hypothetical protein [Novosphingobium resinovorum]GLK44537.1 hypothetical protein GCM10017612_24570 [Novosphingobium resinovorum]
MSNGENAYGVKWSSITWFQRLLNGHENVIATDRHHDIVFDVSRKRGPAIQAICLDEYTCGIAKVLQVRAEFADVNLIYVGGMWNSYTMEAKEYCLQSYLGLFNTTEMAGALHRNDYWAYHKKDKDGNPAYP